MAFKALCDLAFSLPLSSLLILPQPCLLSIAQTFQTPTHPKAFAFDVPSPSSPDLWVTALSPKLGISLYLSPQRGFSWPAQLI